MYETKPYFYGTGRRKHSVARVRVYNGTGKMTINGRDINDYFGLETLKLLANSPLVLTENEGKFDVVVNVVGGGCAGQGKAGRAALLAQYGQLGHGKAAQTGAGSLQKGFLGRKICGGGLGAPFFA